jgi:tRNA A-37 threonylcarbamoyl transferase component Bud32
MSDSRRPERRVGTRIAGRYRLDRLLASGGMAQVWEATDETLRRRVAVKILHDHLADPATIARFRAEGVTAARLTHPGVVAIFDTCSHDGLDAIVMEYVDGPTLRDVLDEQGALPPRRVVPIAIDVADALHAAHRLGLVHRDVKPANILMCPDGTVKVTDFGIAKVRDDGSSDLTLPGTFLGTAKYLAPEQVEGAPVDARTDVYSLGVVLYEMLSGTVPFSGDTDAAIALARLQRTPRPLREVAPDVPESLEAVVARATQRRPDDRYAGMAELGAALRDADLRRRVVADATAVHEAPAPNPRFVESERRWLVPAVFVAVVALSLTLAAVLIGNSDAGQEIVRRAKEAVGAEPAATPATTAAPQDAPTIVQAFSFDPEGTDGEHDADLPKLVDGDPSTEWTTEGYNVRTFGLKSGVGVYAALPTAGDLRDLTIQSRSNGWSASIYVADAPPTTLDGWGAPVAQRSGITPGVTVVDLDGQHGQYVLVWITDLGDSAPRAQTALGELTVTTA